MVASVATLSSSQALELAKIYLRDALEVTDAEIALVLCRDVEESLSQARKAAKHSDDKHLRESIGIEYIKLGKLLIRRDRLNEAQSSYKMAGELGVTVQEYDEKNPEPEDSTADTTNVTHDSSPKDLSGMDVALVPQTIFLTNTQPPSIDFKPPELDGRLHDTSQLAICLALLRGPQSPDDVLDPPTREWLQSAKHDSDEQERLQTLATDVVRAFKRDEFKDSKAVAEVVVLAPILDTDDFRYLLKEFYSGIDQSGLLDVHQLEGLAMMLQSTDRGYFDADDLVKILQLLSTRLSDTHQQSTSHLYQLTLGVSHVLDAMADTGVKGLDREKLHEPLLSYLDGLKSSEDPYLVYQAAYAYQALLCVPDNETLWQATLRRTGKVVKGTSRLVSAVKGIDLNGFVEGLRDIQQDLSGASEIVQLVKDAYDGATSLAKSGKDFLECVNEGLSFSRKSAWYPALRGMDALIRDGLFLDLKRLLCEAPCRRDVAFQWGVVQRLGDVAADPKWDVEIRRGAITFLGEMYQDDAQWGQQPTVKQWILNILMQLSSISDGEGQFAEALLQDLKKSGDASKQALYQECRLNDSGLRPFKGVSPKTVSLSLLDRVQERPDVEGNLRQLRRQRLKEHSNAVYIPPQAKASLQTQDEARFPLMEKIEEFLAGETMVFLLLGDSGAGKSTFNRELEHQLWQSYKKGGVIPLHINLPAIDKPEHDMIAKQLRKVEFTEPQIRELKLHRSFVLICDGYDESQQSHNLYTSNRLNQPGEWKAKMVVSCRNEYLGVDYRDKFQPGDRNQRSESELFQEAVITPFSWSQVQDYISQYVTVHRPLWEVDEYKKALDLIPGLKEFVKNPFLMSLSLDVLPRMVDPGQDFSATHITRMAFCDQFIEHWLERGKKRLGEKNLSSQSRAAFESLSDEGFTQNGIDYLKRLCAAIYREQGGQPIVQYSRYKDEHSWKAEFFSREEENQLLREACPLIRSGNQYRFIHRSLLEYGLALAIFDPRDGKDVLEAGATVKTRRGSTCSALSIEDNLQEESRPSLERLSDLNSPIVWRNFVNVPSVLQFLEERVRQEPLFKQQLLDYIEQSKKDKRWRTAAANAITILVRSGVQFNHTDLRGIQIPHADLSYGVLDSAQLQGADLRKVDLRGAWLRNVDFSGAQMWDVQFGELPYLELPGGPRRIAYSPDGKTLSVGLDNGQIIVYSTSTWEPLWTLSVHKYWITSVVYSPKGNHLASGGDDGVVRLWDLDTGHCSHVLHGHTNEIKSISYSPGGNQVASSSSDCTVRLWDTKSGQCRGILTGHTGHVYRIEHSPKGDILASGCRDMSVRLWDTKAMESYRVLRGHESDVSHVVFSPKGDHVASSDASWVTRLWNVSTGECHHILTGRLAVFSSRGDQMATATRGNTIRLWDVETGVCVNTLLGHNALIQKITYSPQGDLIASAGNDTTIRLWEAKSGQCRQTLISHDTSVLSVLFSPKGDQVVSIGYEKELRLWHVGARTFRHLTNDHANEVKEVVLSPKGDRFATCSNDNTARLWDADTGECLHTLRVHTATIWTVIYSPRGDTIATKGSDGMVHIWCVNTGACAHIVQGHHGITKGISYSPQGDRLASISNNNTIQVWDVQSGELVHTLQGHEARVLSIIYSSDGTRVATCSWDSTIRLWDTETGVCSQSFYGVRGEKFWKVLYSPRGDQIATISVGNIVKLWDVATGKCQHTMAGHSSYLNSIEFSPNGELLATCSDDSTVRLWSTLTGQCRALVIGHRERVNSVVFSPLGNMLVSAGDDKTIRIRDVESGECRAVIKGARRFSDVAWNIAPTGEYYLVIGSGDGSIEKWMIEDEVDDDDDGSAEERDRRYRLRLCWRSDKRRLFMEGTNMQDVQGLSQVNHRLMKQRKAVGEPRDRLRESSKKQTSMAAAVAKLKKATTVQPNGGEEEDEEEIAQEFSGTGSGSESGLEDQLVASVTDHTNYPQLRAIVAAFVKDTHGYI